MKQKRQTQARFVGTSPSRIVGDAFSMHQIPAVVNVFLTASRKRNISCCAVKIPGTGGHFHPGPVRFHVPSPYGVRGVTYRGRYAGKIAYGTGASASN